MISAVPEEDSIAGLLHPTGYRILLRILPPEAKSKSWIAMPDEIREREWAAQLWAEVIELGPDAYKDNAKFPTGPWCKRGDAVVMRPYSGTRFMVRDQLYAIVNDDTVCAVVEGDPGEISRA